MQYIDKLIEAGGSVYEVGGTVRDQLLDRKIKDHDLLVADLPIKRIEKILSPLGDVFYVGKSFGILKFRPYDKSAMEIDIAIPRKEISTGSGHRDFKVEYDPNLPIVKDLERRDFTINAMARNLKDGALIDPFGGKKDLENRVLRQVFDNAFKEDPLRLLRAVQFAARFNLNIEKTTFKAMSDNAGLIKTVSPERIIEELKKLMHAQKPSTGFRTMSEAGILKVLFPPLEATKNISQAKQKGDDVFKHTMKVLDASRNDPEIDNAGDLELMFAALLHDIGKFRTRKYISDEDKVVFYGHQIVSARMAFRLLKRFKSNIIRVNAGNVETLIENHMFETKAYYSEKAIRRFIHKIGKDLIFKLMDLRLADNRGGKYPKGIKGVLKLKKRIITELNKKPPFGAKDLAINGRDLMKLGLTEGPVIGKILSKLVEEVLDNPELNNYDELINKAEELIETRDRSEYEQEENREKSR